MICASKSTTPPAADVGAYAMLVFSRTSLLNISFYCIIQISCIRLSYHPRMRQGLQDGCSAGSLLHSYPQRGQRKRGIVLFNAGRDLDPDGKVMHPGRHPHLPISLPLRRLDTNTPKVLHFIPSRWTLIPFCLYFCFTFSILTLHGHWRRRFHKSDGVPASRL